MWNFLLANSGSSITNTSELATTLATTVKGLLNPILIVLGAAATIYVVYLGFLYAKAEDASKRKEAQGRLIGAVIGLAIILLGITLTNTVNWAAIANGAVLTR